VEPCSSQFLQPVTTTSAKTVVILVLAISALAVWYTVGHLQFLVSRTQLISVDKHYLQQANEAAEAFHGLDQLIVVAEGSDLAETKIFVHDLAERLAADKAQVQEVFYRTEMASLEGKKLLLLSPAELRALRTQVEEHKDVLRDLTVAPGLNTLLMTLNRQMSVAMTTHLDAGLLGLDESADRGEQKASLSFSFLNSLLEQMEQALTASLSYRSIWGNFSAMTSSRVMGFWFPMTSASSSFLVDPQKRGEGLNPRQESIATIRHDISELGRPSPVQAGVAETRRCGMTMLAAHADSPVATVIALVGVGILYMIFFRNLQRTLILGNDDRGAQLDRGLLTLTVGHLAHFALCGSYPDWSR
jgi:hypothetical protein